MAVSGCPFALEVAEGTGEAEGTEEAQALAQGGEAEGAELD